MTDFKDHFRKARNDKLQLSDVELMQILDKATSWSDFNTKRADWLTYRQELRDFPESFPDSLDDGIPTMPLSPTEKASVAASEAAAAEEEANLPSTD